MVYNYIAALQFNCLLCGLSCQPASGIHGLCRFCHQSLPHLQLSQCCPGCALPMPASPSSEARYCGRCLLHPPAFDGSCAAVSYQQAIVPLIIAMKQHFDRATIRLLSQLLALQIQQQPQWPQMQHDIDGLIPSPMHWRRNLQRGNNHSLLLARQLSKQLKIPVNNRIISRTQPSDQQKGLSARERQRNLQNVFSVKKDLAHRHLAIIDDVMTTAATMNSISQCLKQAGAASVYAWSVARTPPPGETLK